jgi:hypothetical protein
MWHKWERRETYTGYWWENLKERVKLQDLGTIEKIMLNWILQVKG